MLLPFALLSVILALIFIVRHLLYPRKTRTTKLNSPVPKAVEQAVIEVDLQPMSGFGDGPVAHQTLSPMLKSPASPRSCGSSMLHYLEEPPLITRKEALKRTPRLLKSASRLTRTQPKTERTLETLVMKYAHARVVTTSADYALDDKYDPGQPVSYLDQVFEKVGALGHGSFGTVYLVQQSGSREHTAVKCLQIPYRGERDRQEKIREVHLQERAQPHENVLRLVGAWEEWDLLYIQTELCEQTLESLIANTEDTVAESRVWDVLIDMVNALDHLHSKNLLHNDIKPENIFIDKNGVCKLGDFGMAVDLNEEVPENGAREGDSQYLSAEVLLGTPTKASDIFSLGLTLLQLATDLLPPLGGTERWHEVRNLKIGDHITKPMSEELKELVFSMMDPDPQKRPTADQIKQTRAYQSRLNLRTLHKFYYRWQGKIHKVAQMFGLSSSGGGPGTTLRSNPQSPNTSADLNRNFDDSDEDMMAPTTDADREQMRRLQQEWELRHSMTPPRSAATAGLRSPRSLRKRLSSMRNSPALERLRLSAPARRDHDPSCEPPSRDDHTPPVVDFD